MVTNAKLPKSAVFARLCAFLPGAPTICWDLLGQLYPAFETTLFCLNGGFLTFFFMERAIFFNRPSWSTPRKGRAVAFDEGKFDLTEGRPLLLFQARREYTCTMAWELDDIRASTECPVCGRGLIVSYRTLRLGRTIECQGCGETIKLYDDTVIEKVQGLIDELGNSVN